MVKKKVSNANFYMNNIKTDFLNPKVPTMKKTRIKPVSFGMGPIIKGKGPRVMPSKVKKIQKINFMPSQKLSITKNINYGLIPKKSASFITTQEFLSPYPPKNGKKVTKKNMNWYQAKQRNPKLGPWGDADKDGVVNIFDCHPYDPNRDGWLSNVAKAVSSGAKTAVSTVSKAVAPVVSTVSKAYTSVDKAVGGVLPGGAPVASKTTTSAPKSTTTTTTTTSTPKTTSTSTSSGGGGGGGRTSTSTTTTTSGGGTTSFNSLLTPVSTPLTDAFTTSKGVTSASPSTTTTTKTLFGGGTAGGRNSTTTTKEGGMTITSKTIEPTKVTVPYDILVVKKDIGTTTITPTPETTTPAPKVIYRYYDSPSVSTPVAPLITSEDIKGFFKNTAGSYYRADRFRPQNVTAIAEITPQQLSEIGIQNAIKGRYPLILNINPSERTKIPSYLLALKPTIIYTPNLPTRLSILAPKTGETGTTEYTEYNVSVSQLPQ